MRKVKSALELALEKLLSHSNLFKYAGHSVDQVVKLILQKETEFNREHRLYQLRGGTKK
jgi:hypothetical protein